MGNWIVSHTWENTPSGTLVQYNLPHNMAIPDGWKIFAWQPNLFSFLGLSEIDPLNPYQPDEVRQVILEKL